LVAVNLALFVWLAVTQDAYLSDRNIQTLLSNLSIVALIGLAQMVVIAAGELNLALGAAGSLSALAACSLMVNVGVPVPLAMAAGVVTGAMCGAFNGYVIGQFGLSSFIVTLATASVFTGVALGFSEAQPITGLPTGFVDLGHETVFGVPRTLLLAAIAAVALAVFFRKCGLGRQILAYGGNSEATELSGLRRLDVMVAVQAISGAVAGWAALLLTAQIGQGQPDVGRDWLLPSFAAPIIGGTLLAGGSLSVTGTCLAALLLTQVGSAIVFIGLDPFWVQFVQGTIIVAAAFFDRTRGRAGRRARSSAETTPMGVGA
jgi:ribose transport system permease protein